MTIHCYSMHSDTGALCGHCSPGDRFASQVDIITCAGCLSVSPWLNSHLDEKALHAAEMQDGLQRWRERRLTSIDARARHEAMREVEQGRGIVDVPGVPQRVEVAVGYDDPTGDDVAADVGPRWKR